MGRCRFLATLRRPLLWGNCLSMVVVIIALVVATLWGLRRYTMHGQTITVPDVSHKLEADARRILVSADLNVVVSDTGYVKELPRDCVLEQRPVAGAQVKAGHTIALIVNATSTPTLSLPDIIQNCSLREAVARLSAMGFQVGDIQYVRGEKDWVYGVSVNGQPRQTGDRISINDVVVVLAGDGFASADDSITVVAPSAAGDAYGADDDHDDFMELPQ